MPASIFTSTINQIYWKVLRSRSINNYTILIELPPRIIWNLLIPRKEKLLFSKNKILLSVTSISKITDLEILSWLKESIFSIVYLTNFKLYSMISKDYPEELSTSNKPYPSPGSCTTIQKNNSRNYSLFCTLSNKKNPVKMILLS